MKKKSICFATVLCIILGVCSCSKPENNSKNGLIVTSKLAEKTLVGNIPCKFPLVDNKDTSLNIMTSVHESVQPEDIYVWKQYEKMTNVKVNWTNVKKSKRAEEVSTALSNRSDVDLIMRCKISASRLTQYGESGLILDLAKDDMLKKNAPNCWAYLQSHPDALAAVTNPDGAIYSLPQVNSGPELRVSRKIFINKKWLKNLNLEVPTTTDEFYQLLKAFKEQDANGNGNPDDEIPFCPYDWLSLEGTFFGAFGLSNRGVHNNIVDFDEENNGVRFIASSESYLHYLQYLNILYSEKLLDNQVFTVESEQWYNNAQNDRIGVFASTNLASLPVDKMNDWVAIDEALEGPDGDKLCTAIRANFHSTGAAVIPTTCETPELVLQWLDYFWTDEGTLFYHMGIENETFKINDDGSYDYMPALYDQIENENKSFDDIIAQYSPYPGGGNPTVEIAPYFKGGEMADIPAKAAKKLFEYGPDEYWPSFTFTADENERLSACQSDITKYIETSRIDFISGEKPFTEWNEYKTQLEKLGENELLDIYQAAVDRYNKLVENNKKNN